VVRADTSSRHAELAPLLFSVTIYWWSVTLSSWRRCSVGKQMTEMLKGTLEGIVLAILSIQPAYGYEITARLRKQGFSDIAEGTVYALLVRIEQRRLVDVEKVPSEKGPPRKVYSLNAQGQEYLNEFWRTWSFLTERLEQLHQGGK
jgi:PadR family transcriptional regulator PadR